VRAWVCGGNTRARARERERERALIFMSQRHSDKNTGALVQTVTLRVSFGATPYRSGTGSHDTPARDQVASPERREIPRKRTGETEHSAVSPSNSQPS